MKKRNNHNRKKKKEHKNKGNVDAGPRNENSDVNKEVLLQRDQQELGVIGNLLGTCGEDGVFLPFQFDDTSEESLEKDVQEKEQQEYQAKINCVTKSLRYAEELEKRHRLVMQEKNAVKESNDALDKEIHETEKTVRSMSGRLNELEEHVESERQKNERLKQRMRELQEMIERQQLSDEMRNKTPSKATMDKGKQSSSIDRFGKSVIALANAITKLSKELPVDNVTSPPVAVKDKKKKKKKNGTQKTKKKGKKK